MNKLSLTLLGLLAVAGSQQTADCQTLSGQYWFDRSEERIPFTSGSFDIPTDGLSEGFHTLHAYVENENGLSSVSSAWFIKNVTLTPGQDLTTVTYIDGVPSGTVTSTVGPDGNCALNLDMSALPLGIHTFGALAVTPSGTPTGYREAMFLRVASTLEMSSMHGFYTIDNMLMGSVSANMAQNTYSLDIDASTLTSGIHSISVFLANKYGQSTTPFKAWFIKIPQGGEGVKSYRYWLNEEESDAVTVTLDKVANPFKLIELIDVKEMPFVSSRHSFSIEKGEPTVMARNTFHLTTLDADGRMTVGEKDYTDQRIRYEINDWGTLNPNSSTKIADPGKNGMKWFRIEAEAGDSISLHLDRAASYEVYGPDATTLISASGADVMSARGITLQENGTHYITVHDFTGGTGDRNLYFEFIEKHALLGHTPECSSNRDPLVMTIRGNGFNNLKSIKIKGASAELAPANTAALNNYTLRALFDLEQTPLPNGDYHLEAVFDDEGRDVTIICPTTLRIEDRRTGDITVSVSPSRVAGTPYKVYVTVTNTGNDGVWGVPLNFAFTDSENDNSYVEGLNFGFLPGSDGTPTRPTIHTDNLLGSGHPGTYTPTYINYMAPSESRTFEIGLTTPAHEYVNMQAWTGVPWSHEAQHMQQSGYTPSSAPRGGNYLSLGEIADILHQDGQTILGMDFSDPQSAADAAIMVGRYACLTGEEAGRYILNHKLHGLDLYKQMLDEEMYKQIGFDEKENMAREMLLVSDDLREAFKSLSGIDGLPDFISGLIKARQRWHAAFSEAYPPVHTIDSKQSGDPNEIHGYTAPSGDSHIGLGVTTLPYTIEFENDPEIANAAATEIRVENNISGDYFDLASFCPTKMIIGKKELDLPAEHHFVRTLDMRPEINAIAELTFDYETATGKAVWQLLTLDPMTMEPTRYFEDGILPVNDDSGRGTGYLSYTIGLKENLADGTSISNSAVIVFDDNEPIATPVCVNTIDITAPEAEIVSAEAADDRLSYTVNVKGEDAGSGIWYYDLYARASGESSWILVRSMSESETIVYESATELPATSFAVVAVDRAGNRGSESAISGIAGDADENGKVDAGDAVVIRNFFTGVTEAINKVNAELTADGKIDAQDAIVVRNLFLDSTTLNKKTMRKKK